MKQKRDNRYGKSKAEVDLFISFLETENLLKPKISLKVMHDFNF